MNTAPKPIRSPAYPNLALRDAVEAVGKIEKLYRSAPVDRGSAVKLIGYKTLSGPANKALAALASYGLLDRAGKGEARVTERARDILHAENENQRRLRLSEAALEPPLFRELRERFSGIPVPPEDGVVTYLNRQGFNPNAVRPAAKAFLNTMSYLQELGVSERNGGGGGRRAESDPPPDPPYEDRVFGGAAVGDLIQWEASGTLKLPEAQRVRAISDDGAWVFVEQSDTGIPMEEVVVERKGEGGKPKPPILPIPTDDSPKEGWHEERLIDDSGNEIFIRYEGEPSVARYEFIRDYLDFRLKRQKK